MADKYDYMHTGNDPNMVKLIKQYALYLLPLGTTLPTDTDWQPGEGMSPVGYNSDDGISLTPNPGKSDDITGHNGDTVASVASGGNWSLKLTGIECTREMAEAYFGVTIGDDGAIHADDASNNMKFVLILAGIDQYGSPIILDAASAQVTDREDMSLVYNKAVNFGCTFTFNKVPGQHMFDIYGLVKPQAAAGSSK